LSERWACRQVCIKAWLDTTLPTVPPKTALDEALAYLHRYWSRLVVRYTERGDLPIGHTRLPPGRRQRKFYTREQFNACFDSRYSVLDCSLLTVSVISNLLQQNVEGCRSMLAAI